MTSPAQSSVGTQRVKRGLAEMLKGGVIMDVVDAEQAKIAEDAGAVAVMALERVPADKLAWKPHAKSMSLGELAMHVAANPMQAATMRSAWWVRRAINTPPNTLPTAAINK